MVEKRSQIKRVIQEYTYRLTELGIKTDRVVLYGSYAAGTSREDSDIDLILVSKDFAKMNLRERLEILGIAAARVRKPIQAIGYTPKEMKNIKKGSFLESVLESKVTYF